MLVQPCVSSAGLYEVSACTESVGYVNNSWGLFNNNTRYLEANSACNQTSTNELSPSLSNLAIGDVLGAGDPPVGTEADWRFVAPAGTSISEVRGSDDLFKDANNDWQVYLRNAKDEVLGGQTCIVELVSSLYCEVSGVFQESGIDTSSVAIGVLCAENDSHNCPDGATIHDVRAELDYATVTINDPVVPTGVAGTQIPASPQHGLISISGTAIDNAAGLLSLSVVNASDETVGGPVAVPGVCNYSFTTPCPTKAENVAIPIDTTKLPNGQDQIRVEATNAAHDEGFSAAITLTVRNEAPPPKTEGSKETGGQSPGGQGGQTSTGQTSSATVPSGVTNSEIPAAPSPVSIHVDHVKRTGTELVISGHLNPTAAETLTVELWHTGSARTILRGLHLHFKDGQFRARIHLARHLRRWHLTIALRYPGMTGYMPASATRILGPVKP